MSDGIGDLGRGFRFLNQHPRLWGWVIAPAIVTLLIMIGLIAGVAYLVDPAVDWLTGWLPGFLQGIASALVWLIVIVGLGAGALFLLVAVVGIVAGPFNEMLSEAVEAKLTGKPGPKFSLAGFVRSFAISLGHGIRRLVVAVLSFLLVFALGFIPVIGTIGGLVLGCYLTARSAAYDSYDAVLSRRELSYDAKLAFLARHRSRTLGLGAGVTAMLFVPGVNLVAFGLGAAGATIASHQLQRVEDPSMRRV
ncbi:MAG: EI24 domain-containing protein [Deltaproteobacteria bacterium]|nr:EI24 domain-containing protein [Deltaproteobacteria bacterium]